MKKVISIALALVMCLAMFTVAFAATIEGDGTQTDPQNADVVVKTTFKDSTIDENGTYTVTIPADIDVTWGKDATYNADYYVVSQLPLGASLKVGVDAADSKYFLKNDAYATDKGIDYTPAGFVEQVFGEVNIAPEATSDGVAPEASVELTFAADAFAAVPLAEYQSNLVYIVTYVAPTPVEP